MHLSDLLTRQKDNNKVAIKHGENSISYHDWYLRSRKLTSLINDAIDAKSLNIAIFLPNSINYAISYFAILFSKKVIIPIGVQSKPSEIVCTIDYCEIDLIITSVEYKEYLENTLSGYLKKVFILFIEMEEVMIIHHDNKLIKKSNSLSLNNDDDIAIMLHTSGTTSEPKRVMLTHNNLINNIESNIKSLHFSVNDIVLISMPMHFGYCNTGQFLTHLYLGASIVILDSMFLPKIFLKTIEEEKVTSFTGVPSMLLMLLKFRYVDKYDISSLKYICFGGGKMPTDELEKLIEKFPTVGFVQTYGQTEASPRCTALLPEDSLRKVGSVGLPIPNVAIKIVDDNADEIKPYSIGEIIVKGKNVMKGYYKREDITRQTIKDGWLYTGDLGYVDNESYLYLTGRKKNMIISGGINIYPEEIEEVLMQNPNIKDVCVVSEGHSLLGEVPIAKIVLYDPKGKSINFREYCAEKLTDYKIPIRFDIVFQIEKTYNGKVKRYS